MGVEIERKFLVRRLPDLEAFTGEPLVQGYLRADAGGSVRLRITPTGAVLTVKGPARGIRRTEYEYPVPAEDARHMLDEMALGTLVEKVRFRIPWHGHVWEVDVFAGRNAGLVVAEIELADEKVQPELPEWLGREVTDDHRYLNSSLTRAPYDTWAAEDTRQ